MGYLDQLISEYEQDGWIAGTQEWCKDMIDEVKVLQSRLESLEKDAARWRHASNDRVSGRGFDIVVCRATWGQKVVYEVLSGDMADECIDAAMQANKVE